MTDELELLRWIDNYQRAHGYAPCRREIAEHLDVQSKSTAQKRVLALRDRGLIRVADTIGRGIIITEAGMKAIGDPGQ